MSIPLLIAPPPGLLRKTAMLLSSGVALANARPELRAPLEDRDSLLDRDDVLRLYRDEDATLAVELERVLDAREPLVDLAATKVRLPRFGRERRGWSEGEDGGGEQQGLTHLCSPAAGAAR